MTEATREKQDIIFMQTRLLRCASEEWKLPIDKIVKIFSEMNLFDYIEKGYGIFCCEGDNAIMEDINEVLKIKGYDVYAYELSEE